MKTAEEIRREKLKFLRQERALTADAEKKFELDHRIQELENQLEDDEGTAPKSPNVSIARLPTPGEHFLGRDAELQALDQAWTDDATRVFVLVAFGGVGKSALVYKWLDALAADDWRGAERVLGWSFYSQGTDATAASADAFVDFALNWLGHEGEVPGSPRRPTSSADTPWR